MFSNQELRTSTKKELLRELAEAHEMMLKKGITVKTKHDKDSSSISKQRKYVARVKTAIKELELGEMVKESKKII
jgi:ribosomal protein L29